MEKFLLKLQLTVVDETEFDEESKIILKNVIKEIKKEKFEMFNEAFEYTYSVDSKKISKYSELYELIFDVSVSPKEEKKKFFDDESLALCVSNLSAIDEDMLDFLSNLVICMNIAYPGIIVVEKITLEKNEKCIDITENVSSCFIHELYFEFKEQNWIKFQKLNMCDVWHWLKTKTSFLEVKTISDGYMSDIDKSLNSFSHIFGSDDFEMFFYIMIAIEAIYNTSKSIAIGYSIKSKLTKLFGESKELEKKVKEIYDKRSRIIHGDILLAKKNYSGAKQDEIYYSFFEKDFLPALRISVVIYIATIQLYIKNNSNVMVEQMILNFE